MHEGAARLRHRLVDGGGERARVLPAAELSDRESDDEAYQQRGRHECRAHEETQPRALARRRRLFRPRLALHHLHERCLQPRRRLELLHGPGQRVRGGPQPLELLLAVLAAGDMALERLPLEVVQRIEQVGADVVLVARVVAHATTSRAGASSSPGQAASFP